MAYSSGDDGSGDEIQELRTENLELRRQQKAIWEIWAERPAEERHGDPDENLVACLRTRHNRLVEELAEVKRDLKVKRDSAQAWMDNHDEKVKELREEVELRKVAQDARTKADRDLATAKTLRKEAEASMYAARREATKFSQQITALRGEVEQARNKEKDA